MDNFVSRQDDSKRRRLAPLAERLRPTRLDEILGQSARGKKIIKHKASSF
jgi:replication-associated recombination protein RarA